MAAPPATTFPTISPAEIQILISRAGLMLNPGQVADLVLAWRQVAGLIAAMPHDRPLADDMAVVFRLPPPAGATLEEPARKAPANAPAKASAKTATSPAPKGTIKAATVRAKAKAAPSKQPARPAATAAAKTPARPVPAKKAAKPAPARKAAARR